MDTALELTKAIIIALPEVLGSKEEAPAKAWELLGRVRKAEPAAEPMHAY